MNARLNPVEAIKENIQHIFNGIKLIEVDLTRIENNRSDNNLGRSFLQSSSG